MFWCGKHSIQHIQYIMILAQNLVFQSLHLLKRRRGKPVAAKWYSVSSDPNFIVLFWKSIDLWCVVLLNDRQLSMGNSRLYFMIESVKCQRVHCARYESPRRAISTLHILNLCTTTNDIPSIAVLYCLHTKYTCICLKLLNYDIKSDLKHGFSD